MKRGYRSIKEENKCIVLETYLQVTDAANVALLNAGTTFGTQLGVPTFLSVVLLILHYKKDCFAYAFHKNYRKDPCVGNKVSLQAKQ